MLRIVESPRFGLPGLVEASAWLDESDALPPGKLPESLAKAVLKRKREYLAGRHCAALALGRLDPSLPTELPSAENRAPVWPAGVAGSLTHSNRFVAACVARSVQYRGVGRDTERLLDERTAKEISSAVCTGDELERLGRETGEDSLRLLSLLFSAKESLFKCLHPLHGRFFEFSAAQLASVNLKKGEYRIELVKTVADEFPTGYSLTGKFLFQDSLVHTLCVLPA